MVKCQTKTKTGKTENRRLVEYGKNKSSATVMITFERMRRSQFYYFVFCFAHSLCSVPFRFEQHRSRSSSASSALRRARKNTHLINELILTQWCVERVSSNLNEKYARSGWRRRRVRDWICVLFGPSTGICHIPSRNNVSLAALPLSHAPAAASSVSTCFGFACVELLRSDI